jgi:hypothetical protein
MIVGSLRSDYTTISVSNRPSTVRSPRSDPFFLLAPDLKPINGLVRGVRLAGHFDRAGADLQPRRVERQGLHLLGLLPGLGCGRRGVAGLYRQRRGLRAPRPGREPARHQPLRQLRGRRPQPQHRRHHRRLYRLDDGVQLAPRPGLPVPDRRVRGVGVRHRHARRRLGQPVDALEDGAPARLPADVRHVDARSRGRPRIRLHGRHRAATCTAWRAPASGDGGTTDISVEFLSKLFTVPLNAEAFNDRRLHQVPQGRRGHGRTGFEYAGEAIFNQTLTVKFPRSAAATTTQRGLLQRMEATTAPSAAASPASSSSPPAAATSSRSASVTGSADFAISEIGLRFRAAG